MKASYTIQDDERFFPVRAEIGGKVIATLTRPLVCDRTHRWTLHDTAGELVMEWFYRPTRTEVTQALQAAGLM